MLAQVRELPGFVAFEKCEIEQSIGARFEAQVAARPTCLAVKHGETALSYAALDRLANRIANHVLALRGSGEEPVALLMDQGAPLVAAILGLLKAGKIYVPLDPAHDGERLAEVLRDCMAAVLLVDAANRGTAEQLPLSALTIVDAEQALATASEAAPRLAVAPDRLAYIYYTSGSTGRPKGVADDHRNVLHNVMRYTNSLRIGASDRLSLIQGPAFSGAVSSLFSALLNGAAVFPIDLRRAGIGSLGRLVREERLTMFHAVPTIFEQLVRSGGDFPSLRVIRLEGDQAFLRHVALFKAHFAPPCVLVNGLGATETGLTRQFFVHHDTEIAGSVVPIGYAAEDMTALLLSSDGTPVPSGEVGAIAIRSRFLARGYWRNPALTEAAFSACPDYPGERLYRTGDLGRLRPDGCLEYLGRSDFRAKLHGQWVDLEAIQQALDALPGVKESLVLCREDAEGRPKLVAYLIPEAAPGPTPQRLRRALAERLPASPLPSAFIPIENFPRDRNGKISRRDLPPPDTTVAERDGPCEAPRDELEASLIELWCEILERDEIGIHDDFFALGDSLQALTLALRIEQRFDRPMPLSAVLEAPSVARMAALLRSERAPSCLVALQPEGAKRPFFCVHGHDGEVLSLRRLAQHLGPERPVYGLRAAGLEDSAAPETTIEAMAARYLRELRQIQPSGPYLLGGYCFGGLVALEMSRQLEAGGARVACLALIDSETPEPLRLPSPGVWLGHHGRALLRLRGRARRTYLDQRLRNARNVALRHGRLLVGRPLRRLCRALGWSAPRLLRQPALLSDLALAAYRPRPFAGPALLFAPRHNRAGRPDPFAGWNGLILDGLDRQTLDVEASALMAEPHVAMLARAVATALERAEARDGALAGQPPPSSRLQGLSLTH